MKAMEKGGKAEERGPISSLRALPRRTDRRLATGFSALKTFLSRRWCLTRDSPQLCP